MVEIVLPRAVGAQGPAGPMGPGATDQQVASVVTPIVDAKTAGKADKDGSNVEADAFRGAIGSFANRAEAETKTAADSRPSAVQTDFYAESFDGGGALYVPVTGEPSHAGKLFSYGQWWEISTPSVYVEQFGAKGDGVTDDYAAIQGAHDYLIDKWGGGDLLFRARTYYVSQPISVRSSGSYYQKSPVVNLCGMGARTVLTRRMFSGADAPDVSDEEACRSSAAIALYCSNAIIDGLSFEDAGAGIFLGQDPTTPGVLTNASMNRIRNIWIKNCGVGFAGFVAENAYYNGFSDWHISQCKYGFVMDWHAGSPVAGVIANFNRNQLRNIRIGRCWVGLWNKAGGTNTGVGFHFEGNSKTPPTDNRYSAPTDIPAARLGTPVAMINGPKAGGNWFSGIWENNGWDIHNEGIHNSFEGDIDGGKCAWVQAPTRFLIPEAHVFAVNSATSALSLKAAPQDNTRVYGDTTVPGGVDFTKAARGSELYSVERGKRHFMGAGCRHQYAVDAGAFTTDQTKAGIIIQPGLDEDYMKSSSGRLRVTVVGYNAASNLAHTTEFDVYYNRSSSRSVTRLFLTNITGGVATGLPGGGDTERFTPVVSAAGTSGREIHLSLLTPPGRAMAKVVVFIDSVSTRDPAIT